MSRQHFLRLLIIVLCLGLSESHARLISVLSYQQLFDRSDLVVIGVPVSKTADTKERSALPNIVRQDPDGTKHPITAIGVETSFRVCLVLKGDKDMRKLVLHHYREESQAGAISGPALVSFDPQDQGYSYLMFLAREKDGRYAPTGGQTDPAFKSVSQLAFDIGGPADKP
ncbi:MAG: hypothetical protein ACLPXM_15710 [Terriglobales bacterium]